VAADHDRQLDVGQARDGRGPEAGRVDHDRCLDVLARRGLDAGDVAGRVADGHDFDTLFDARTVAARRIRIATRYGGGIAIARIRLVEHRAESPRIDPRLDAREVAGLEHLGTDADRPLEPDGRLELRPHGDRDADQRPARDVARFAADGVAEALEDAERSHDHPTGLRSGVELADDPDGSAGAARGQGPSLEQDDVAQTGDGEVKRDRRSGDTAADDDDGGPTAHLAPAAVSSAARSSSSRRTGSPRWIVPSTRTRA
jgi:hypothetical protein